MIPASHIKFSDDRKTAWVVFDDDDNERLARSSHAFVSDLDRPCSTCGGHGSIPNNRIGGGWMDDCEFCHGSGRPCFDIDVAPEYIAAGWDWPGPSLHRLTVSVVEGMVLGPLDDGQFVGESDYWYEEPNILRHFHDDQNDITLPDAAAVGMFAVWFNVHTPIEGDDTP